MDLQHKESASFYCVKCHDVVPDEVAKDLREMASAEEKTHLLVVCMECGEDDRVARSLPGLEGRLAFI